MTRIEVSVHKDYFPGAHWVTTKEWDDDEFEDNHTFFRTTKDQNDVLTRSPNQIC